MKSSKIRLIQFAPENIKNGKTVNPKGTNKKMAQTNHRQTSQMPLTRYPKKNPEEQIRNCFHSGRSVKEIPNNFLACSSLFIFLYPSTKCSPLQHKTRNTRKNLTRKLQGKSQIKKKQQTVLLLAGLSALVQEASAEKGAGTQFGKKRIQLYRKRSSKNTLQGKVWVLKDMLRGSLRQITLLGNDGCSACK